MLFVATVGADAAAVSDAVINPGTRTTDVQYGKTAVVVMCDSTVGRRFGAAGLR